MVTAQESETLLSPIGYRQIALLLTEHHLEFLSLKRRLQRLVRVYTCQNVKLLEISCLGSIILNPDQQSLKERQCHTVHLSSKIALRQLLSELLQLYSHDTFIIKNSFKTPFK